MIWAHSAGLSLVSHPFWEKSGLPVLVTVKLPSEVKICGQCNGCIVMAIFFMREIYSHDSSYNCKDSYLQLVLANKSLQVGDP